LVEQTAQEQQQRLSNNGNGRIEEVFVNIIVPLSGVTIEPGERFTLVTQPDGII
jgi:hypothetical protein